MMYPWLQEPKQQISEQIRADKLPHALLIVGVDGSGKTSLAHWLIDLFACQNPNIESNGVLSACGRCKCCLLKANSTYPDTFSVLENDRSISVEQIRSAIHFLETTPQIGHGKSVLISHANKLTLSAANALLKTLEEPNNNTLLVLFCPEVTDVPITIASRCQTVTLRPFVGSALSDRAGVNEQENDPFLNVSQLALAQNAEQYQAFMNFQNAVLTLLDNNQASEQVIELAKTNVESINWLEKIIVDLIREQNSWQVRSSVANTNVPVDKQQLLVIYKLVIAVQKKLKLLPQVNYAMLVEQLTYQISETVA